jgi:hypothetical protein
MLGPTHNRSDMPQAYSVGRPSARIGEPPRSRPSQWIIHHRPPLEVTHNVAPAPS